MANYAYSIPTHIENTPPPPFQDYVTLGIGTITLDPDGILTAGANAVGQPAPNAQGFITNNTLSAKTLYFSIDLNLSITSTHPQSPILEIYVGSATSPFFNNSQQIAYFDTAGTFLNNITGTINIAPNSSVCFWIQSGFCFYTIDADISGYLDKPSVTIGNHFYCDISPDCVTLPYNQNRIICAELQFVQCFAGDCAVLTTDNGLIICSENDSWNCNLCANDLPYNSPVVIGDSLYFQFQQQDLLNGNSPTLDGGGLWGNGYGWDEFGLVQGYIRDCCTGQRLQKPGGGDAVVTDYSSNYFVGIFEGTNYSNTSNTYTNIQQIKIETGQLYTDIAAQFSGNCFYFEWVFYPNDLAYTYQLFSEPFEFVTCDETIMLEGTTSIKDCFNLFYGDPGCVVVNKPITIGPITLNNYQKECLYYIGTGLFPYTQFYRVRGSLEQTSFEITKDLVGTKLRSTSIDLTENWLLRTDRLPQRAAKLVASILASQNVYIDNKEYVVDGELPKNNEIGNQWFIDANLRKVTCSKNYSCN